MESIPSIYGEERPKKLFFESSKRTKKRAGKAIIDLHSLEYFRLDKGVCKRLEVKDITRTKVLIEQHSSKKGFKIKKKLQKTIN